MKISLTGCSSTGKTTLAKALIGSWGFGVVPKFIFVDGRRILDEMGCKSMDTMSRNQQKEYQVKYFHNKIESEDSEDNYITDRSFVDIASYWLVRDTFDEPLEEQNKLVLPCQRLAKKYDFTFYLPTGILEFEKDGYRPENADFNKLVDEKIQYLLNDWGIRYYKIDMKSLTDRVTFIHNILRTISSTK